MPTVGSLFSGIGGLDLGLERAGWEVRWQVENNDFCRKVLNKHWPKVPLFGDVHDVGKELEYVDLICGGFPCQSVSEAGRRRGRDDERWLWPQMARIVRHLAPRFVLIENVRGLRSAPGAFEEILRDLARYGYDAEWAGIPAVSLGALHRRRRIFIVAERRSEAQPSTLNPNTNGQRSHTGKKTRGARQAKDRNESQRDPSDLVESVSHSQSEGLHGRPVPDGGRPQESEGERRIFTRTPSPTGRNWISEPRVDRVVDGVSDRVDRTRAIGNAVVPQVAEWVGRQIIARV